MILRVMKAKGPVVPMDLPSSPLSTDPVEGKRGLRDAGAATASTLTVELGSQHILSLQISQYWLPPLAERHRRRNGTDGGMALPTSSRILLQSSSWAGTCWAHTSPVKMTLYADLCVPLSTPRISLHVDLSRFQYYCARPITGME